MKPSLSKEQKQEEGRRLKAAWQRHRDRTGETQEKFCERIGMNQGLLQQYFRGKTAIQIENLMDMAIEMEFDPREIRPSVQQLLAKMLRAIEGPT